MLYIINNHSYRIVIELTNFYNEVLSVLNKSLVSEIIKISKILTYPVILMCEWGKMRSSVHIRRRGSGCACSLVQIRIVCLIHYFWATHTLISINFEAVFSIQYDESTKIRQFSRNLMCPFLSSDGVHFLFSSNCPSKFTFTHFYTY